ncbi:hypothetical protein [Roseitranquillus sediminis]|uniref:hypothetical protein n=1 Tax=Roseitranquillus sediminis TaxID=2809051 RepID=UPI001D0CBC7E|nr:hypothetical protein [Roseitranquillus sediminis]MBM9593945.1 hypothetical protein [Roseitranquillus sediminis]
MKYSKIETRRVPQVCEELTTHDRIKIQQAASLVPDEKAQKEKKTELRPPGAGAPICTPELSGGKEVNAMEDGRTIDSGALSDQFGIAVAAKPRPSVEIDTAKYQKYLDDPSLSEDQKEEIIQALWLIITAFVDLGFGVHPAQQVQEQEAGDQAALVLDEEGKIYSNDPK